MQLEQLTYPNYIPIWRPLCSKQTYLDEWITQSLKLVLGGMLAELLGGGDAYIFIVFYVNEC